MTTAQLQAYARAQALRYGVNPTVFLRQISQESGWNPSARSSAGALGIAQIMPSTAASWGVNPLDPRAALAAAAKHDAYYLHQYGGNYRKMLAAYNAGPGAVASGAWTRYPQTTHYVASILAGVGNPHSFARGSVAAGAGGGGIAGGGGGAAMRGVMAPMPPPPPIQVAPAQPVASAQMTLQNLLANQLQSEAPVFPQATTPSVTDLSTSLDSIHQKLLGG